MKELFRIRAKALHNGEVFELSEKDFTFSESKAEYVFAPLDIKVKIKTLSSDGEKLQKIFVAVNDKSVIEQVRFPVCPKTELTNYDKLLVSTAWGDIMEHPAQQIKQYCMGRNSGNEMYGWIRAISDLEVSYMYPSIMSMQYVVLFNQAKSFYLASYSTGEESHSFNIAAYSNSSYNLELSICHYPYISGEEWESPVCSRANLGAGWHEAADLYSSHMSGKFGDPDLPQWMKDDSVGFHGWLATPMKAWGHTSCRFNELASIYKEKVAPTGLNTMHVYGWCNNGHDTLYPNYYPNPELGTADELRAACEEIKSLGGHIILYTNGRIVDPESEFFKNGGNEDVCIDENGKPYEEIWGPDIHYRVNCPSQTAYHRYMSGAVERIIKEYGANAIQIDQTSCNYGEFCFNKNHNHSKPSNNFLGGLTEELKTIRNTYKSLNKDFFVWCEGCHERFGKYYDVEQGHGEAYSMLHIGSACPEQFKYTFKNRIVSGLALDLQQMCYSFIQGKPFDAKVAKIADSDYAALITQLVAVRKKYPEIYLRGSFMDNKGIDSDKYSRCGSIISEDGSEMMLSVWKQGADYKSVRNNSAIRLPDGWKVAQTVFPTEAVISEIGSGIYKMEYNGSVAAVLLKNEKT